MTVWKIAQRETTRRIAGVPLQVGTHTVLRSYGLEMCVVWILSRHTISRGKVIIWKAQGVPQ